MRDLMKIVEEPFVRRTTAHVPFSQVTADMIAKAFVDASDLRDVLEAGRWEDMYGEYADEDVETPRVPQRSEDLAPEQLHMLMEYYKEAIQETHAILEPIASQTTIPIYRHLGRLADLNQPLGVHWSFGEEVMHHMSEFGEHVVFGVVSPDAVDWVTTFGRAICWWSSEREITPVAGAPIKLTRLVFGEEAMGTA